MVDLPNEAPQAFPSRASTRRQFIETIAAASAFLPALHAQTGRPLAGGPLENLFLSPPRSAKPWVFWLWSAYDDKEGMTKDLEALQRQGIGGILFSDEGSGQLSQPWNEGLRHLLREADRLGLDFNANIANGLDTGGPWATTDLAAKKLVYAETQVHGPESADLVLPLPLLVDRYYQDVAVVAFPERADCPVTPYSVAASSTLGGYVDEWNWPPWSVCDRDAKTYWRSNPAAPTKEAPAWLDLVFSVPMPATGLYIAPTPEGGLREAELQVAVDGGFRTLLSFTMEKGKAKRLSFPQSSASRFRLLIHSAYVPDVQLAEVWILREGDEPHSRDGLKWWPFKSGNRGFWDYPKQGPEVLQEEYPGAEFDFHSTDVIDLTQSMDQHGRLRWQIPAGRWTILRFGCTLIPPRSSCAPNSQCGYLIDLFKPSAADVNIDTEVQPMLADAASLPGATISGVHLDSYEYGVYDHGQLPTWTDDFREQFGRRRGYAMLPYLPVLAHRIVESREVSDRFLWDNRRTMGDLYTAFYARLRKLANERKLETNHENGYGTYPFPHIDGLEAFGQTDVPQGEFWTATPIMSQFYHFCDSVRTAASAAHIYGKRLVQSEAFSTWLPPYQCFPGVMKSFGDQAFCDGLQQCVIFCSTNQTSDVPGNDQSGYEIINRHITWQKQGRAFFDYLARCQYLLQQGQFTADLIYFYGEGTAKFVPAREFLRPALPAGFDFDGLNADVLLNRLSADSGRLVLPDGMSYRMLVLPDDREMSLPVLRKVRALIEAGATVLGRRPLRTVGLRDYPQSDADVRSLSEEMWGAADAQAGGERKLGKGRLVWGKDPAAVLAEMKVFADFEVRDGSQGARLNFIHRRRENQDIYFVVNPDDRSVEAQCVFRVGGRQPEIWNPVTGEVRSATDFRQEEGRTVVPMKFAPHESFFVVFQKPAGEPKRRRPNFPEIAASVELAGAWTVHFDPKWGGPDSAEFQRLDDWTKRPEEGIKYYSGTATYRKTFRVPSNFSNSAGTLLDLGDFRNLAEVRLNGENLGVLWTKPYRVEITHALRPGDNELEIDIVNLWVNRLIGDAGRQPGQRFTQTDVHSIKKDDPLVSSGLFGPVRLQTVSG